MSDTWGYRRHLPHQLPDRAPLFLTWNLKGAMPKAALAQVERERERLEKRAPRAGETPRDRRIREDKILFAFADRLLDERTEGPMHLKDPRAAKTVEDAIIFWSGTRYDLFAWCIMANHVHLVITLRPKLGQAEAPDVLESEAGRPDVRYWELRQVTQGIKGYTAREINRFQDARGRVLWLDESYDHWARDESELMAIIEYVENNPVAARLCRLQEGWPWSSARLRKDWLRGEAYRKATTGDIVAPWPDHRGSG
jgi:type I restriction enzyme R subunit